MLMKPTHQCHHYVAGWLLIFVPNMIHCKFGMAMLLWAYIYFTSAMGSHKAVVTRHIHVAGAHHHDNRPLLKWAKFSWRSTRQWTHMMATPYAWQIEKVVMWSHTLHATTPAHLWTFSATGWPRAGFMRKWRRNQRSNPGTRGQGSKSPLASKLRKDSMLSWWTDCDLTVWWSTTERVTCNFILKPIDFQSH